MTGQYTYEDRSNRLVAPSLPGSAWASYPHDYYGQMVAMSHLPAITWTPSGQMASAQLNAGSPPHMAYYVYDASGERTRKIVVRGTNVTERLYLGGYEVFREYTGTTTLETEEETLHVGADVGRLLLVETKTVESGSQVTTPDPKWRFQLSNQIGSVAIELDDSALVITYEEYHPYGTSAYLVGATANEADTKRYRYTGMERDGETGLQYHSARYLAVWLGRWASADPEGVLAGPNGYQVVRSQPMQSMDPTGRQEERPIEAADHAPGALYVPFVDEEAFWSGLSAEARQAIVSGEGRRLAEGIAASALDLTFDSAPRWRRLAELGANPQDGTASGDELIRRNVLRGEFPTGAELAASETVLRTLEAAYERSTRDASGYLRPPSERFEVGGSIAVNLETGEVEARITVEGSPGNPTVLVPAFSPADLGEDWIEVGTFHTHPFRGRQRPSSGGGEMSDVYEAQTRQMPGLIIAHPESQEGSEAVIVYGPRSLVRSASWTQSYLSSSPEWLLVAPLPPGGLGTVLRDAAEYLTFLRNLSRQDERGFPR